MTDPDEYDEPYLGEEGELDERDRAFDDDDDRDWHDEPRDAPRRRRRRRGAGCLPVLIALVVIAAGVFFGGRWAVTEIRTHLASAPDYAGPGSGSVLVEVRSGDTSVQIGSELKAKGVVESVGAFTDAARADDRSRNIQVGYYDLKKGMKASAALAVLVNPKNLIQALVVVPEGARVRSIVATIVAKTHITKQALTQALEHPASIGLPAEAKGNPEGFLFPATYSVPPNETAVQLLSQMVAKTVAVDKSLDLSAKAAALGYTPEQILTVASILEYEADRGVDYPKVARVIYNRLAQKMPLQLDSTVAYVSGRAGDVWTTDAERANNSLYNTYVHQGLPPGPIGSPGQQTIEAALNPAQGNWLYFLPDFQHHTTLYYAQDGPQRQADLARIKAYCLTTTRC